MKKGILLVLIVTSFIIVSCAAHEHPADTNAKITDITEEFDNLTRVEAYQKTANDLYMGALTQNGFNNLLKILTEIEDGTLQGNGIGEVTSPYVAAVIIQKLYNTMRYLPATVTGTTRETLEGIADPVKLETNYDQIRSALVTLDSTLYKTLADQYKPFVQYQDLISNTVKKYANMLLTSSSSASKPSGSDDTVAIDTFYVVVNVAATISSSFSGEITGPAGGVTTDNDTIISLIADNLYNLTDATKLQTSYNQSLREFLNVHYYNLADNDSFAMFKDVLTGFINNDGKTSGPQMGDTDSGDYAEPIANPYIGTASDDTEFNGGTSATIYDVIAKRLYGAPLDPTRNYTETGNLAEFLDNNTTSYVSRQNALTFYQELRRFGMKIPYRTVTSIPGHKTIADIISKHLRQNGFDYNDFNVNNDADTGAAFNNSVIAKMTTTVNGATPICALVQEVNAAIDDSTISFFGNEGDYNYQFLGINRPTLPNTSGSQMNSSNLNSTCQITLTKVDETGKIIEYLYNADGYNKTALEGEIYSTQDNSTAL